MKQHLLNLLACALTLLAGCDKKNTSTDSGAQPKAAKGTIGVSLLTLDNPFFKVIGDHIASEGRKHGYEAIVVSGDKDPAKQGNQIKDFRLRPPEYAPHFWHLFRRRIKIARPQRAEGRNCRCLVLT